MAFKRTRFSERLSRLPLWWQAFASSRRGALALRVGRWAFMVGIVAYLLVRLTHIGWGEVVRSLPATPWFYVLFVIAFLQLPFIETLIYRIVWTFSYWRGLGVFFKKRIFNQDVLGYSGEVYLYVWAKKHIAGVSDWELMKTIRDNNIISSVASTGVAIGLLAFFVYGQHVDLSVWVDDYSGLQIGLAVVVVVVLAVLAARFRRYLFSMPLRQAGTIFSIHVVRLLIVNALVVAQWVVVIPEVALSTWFTFLAVSIVLDRIPVLPNRDLLFFGVGLQMSGALGVPEAALAGMLLASNVLTRCFNLFFLAVSFFFRREGAGGDIAVPSPEPGVAAES